MLWSMNRKLDEDSAQALLNRVAGGESQKALAREYGISEAAVSKLVSGKTWPHLQRCSPPSPTRHGSKLSPSDIPTILARLAKGDTPTEVAMSYGITRQAVVNIQKGTSWAGVSRQGAPRPPRRKKVWEQ